MPSVYVETTIFSYLAARMSGDLVTDALHVAVAAIRKVDYLATWNLRHLAGAVMRRRIEHALRERGFDAPVMCTPEAFLTNSMRMG